MSEREREREKERERELQFESGRMCVSVMVDSEADTTSQNSRQAQTDSLKTNSRHSTDSRQ